MMIIDPSDTPAIFELGPHRPGALYPPNGPNTRDVERGAGNEGRERGQAGLWD